MKRAALILVAFLAFSAQPARAQDEPVWNDESGRISLTFGALGWSEVELADDPRTLLAIQHRAFQESGRMRACFVTERRQTVPNDDRLAQGSLNTITTTMGLGALERTVGSPSTRGEIVTVDGVAVIDAVFDGPIRRHMRVFYMKDGSDLVQVLISCGAGAPVEAEVEGNIAELLQTLRINPE